MDIKTSRTSHIACFRETLTRHESGLLSTFEGANYDHTCTRLHACLPETDDLPGGETPTFQLLAKLVRP